MKRDTTLEYWPDHLCPVFTAVGMAMEGKRLHPEVLTRVSGRLGEIVPDHQVTIAHLSGEAAKPGGNRYTIEIKGPRIVGGWSFRSGELERLAQTSMIGSGDASDE